MRKVFGLIEGGAYLVTQHHTTNLCARLLLEDGGIAHWAFAIHLLREPIERLLYAHVAHDAAAIQHAQKQVRVFFSFSSAVRVRTYKRVITEQQGVGAAYSGSQT